jgi:hypothetical protein
MSATRVSVTGDETNNTGLKDMVGHVKAPPVDQVQDGCSLPGINNKLQSSPGCYLRAPVKASFEIAAKTSVETLTRKRPGVKAIPVGQFGPCIGPLIFHMR